MTFDCSFVFTVITAVVPAGALVVVIIGAVKSRVVNVPVVMFEFPAASVAFTL